MTDAEVETVVEALRRGALGGNGSIGRQVQAQLRHYLGVKHALLTTSCSHALEMAMLALNLGPGDEVILPSFAFVSAATAILRQGARPIFAEVDETTFNLDPADVARRITTKTRAILPVHYAGQGCNMTALLALAAHYRLAVVEDAAQALGASYNQQKLGTIGDIGCYSFHVTKNIICGEGGAFITNDDDLARRAEIIREKGTNRSAFLRGEVDKYTWVDLGSSYVLSDLLAAVLSVQLERVEAITQARRIVWQHYYEGMAALEARGLVIRPGLDPQAEINGHIYAFRVDPSRRDGLLAYLKQRHIEATFHFVPLHSSPYAQEHLGYRPGDLPITERLAHSLIRLPLYPHLSAEEVAYILEMVEYGLTMKNEE